MVSAPFYRETRNSLNEILKHCLIKINITWRPTRGERRIDGVTKKKEKEEEFLHSTVTLASILLRGELF